MQFIGDAPDDQGQQVARSSNEQAPDVAMSSGTSVSQHNALNVDHSIQHQTNVGVDASGQQLHHHMRQCAPTHSGASRTP